MSDPVLVHRSMFTPDHVEYPDTSRTGDTHASLDTRAISAKAIRLQIKTIEIVDGLQGKFGTKLGAATGVYLISTVVDGNGQEPVVFQGKTYTDIKNGDKLPLGTTPDSASVFNVYLREGEMPRLLSFSLLVLRSNQGMRDLFSAFNDVRADQRYQKLSDIITLAATAANPALGTIWQAADEVMGLVGSALQATPDDQLCYYQANYTNAFDNLGVGRHPQGKKLMDVAKVSFAYQIDALAE